MELVQKWGTKWSKIVKMLPGRTDNAIKNRWNSTMRKNLRRQLKEAGSSLDGGVGALLAEYNTDNMPVRKRGSATSAEVATAAAAAAVTAAAAASGARAGASPGGVRARPPSCPHMGLDPDPSPKISWVGWRQLGAVRPSVADGGPAGTYVGIRWSPRRLPPIWHPHGPSGTPCGHHPVRSLASRRAAYRPARQGSGSGTPRASKQRMRRGWLRAAQG